MPLRASIDGKEIIAPFIDDSEWNSLKKDISSGNKQAILPCCQNLGLLRTSKLGTKHFYHKHKLNCSWEPETKEHLRAKYLIVIACKNAGFEASTEVIGSDWIADVLATKGSAKIAFEVQLSPQTALKTLERNERYKRDGIICCWLFNRIPIELISSNFTCFEICQLHEKFVVYLNTILPSVDRKKEYKNLHEIRLFHNACGSFDSNGKYVYHNLIQSLEPEVFQWENIYVRFNRIEQYLTDFIEDFLLGKIKFNGTYWDSEKLNLCEAHNVLF